MTNVAKQHGIRVEGYLAGEAQAGIKHEYLAGEVFAIAGASDAHVTIAGNLFALLRSHVRGSPCRTYMADMKVRIETADAFYYPDVLVTCDARDARETLFKRHPRLVIEVLSDSTAAFDRGAKFAHYRELESLAEYVLIEPEAQAVDVFRRNGAGRWMLHPCGASDTLDLASLGLRCTMQDSIFFPTAELGRHFPRRPSLARVKAAAKAPPSAGCRLPARLCLRPVPPRPRACSSPARGSGRSPRRMLRAIRLRSRSTSRTLTLTRSPVLTTSWGSLTKRRRAQ